MPVKREPAEPQGFIKLTGVGIPRLQAGEDVNVMTQDAAQNGTSDKRDNHTYHELDEPQSIRRSRFTSTGEWPYRIINTQRHDDRGY